MKKYQNKINLLGTHHSYDATFFINMRILTSLVLIFLLIYIFDIALIPTLLISIGYYFLLPYIAIGRKINKRKAIINNDALYFFEILTLSLETGKDLKTSLEITTDSISSTLSDEFYQSLTETNNGKSFNGAMKDLKKRIPSELVNNIITNILTSNTLGNNILDIIYDQIDYIRESRTSSIKASMSKLPLRVSIISVLFFIPLIMLLILAPLIINYLS